MCSGTAITPGTLTSAAYQVSFSYDAMNHVRAGNLGSYTYGDSAHVHAATAAGSNGQGGPYYSASYDAVGDMTCRAPNSATTCVGSSPTGQQMTYDAERRRASAGRASLRRIICSLVRWPSVIQCMAGVGHLAPMPYTGACYLSIVAEE